MPRPVAIAAGCLILFFDFQAGAQQKPPAQTPQAPVFRSTVDLVHLDVSVLDKDRRPVRGLTAEDFTVLEDGKPQSIVAFTAVDVPENPPTPAAWSGRAPADVQSNEGVQDPDGRLFVVLLDDAMMPPSPAALETARQVAKKFIDRVTPVDRVAVVFSGSGRNQNFTNDRARLFSSIDSLKTGHATYLGGWESAMMPNAVGSRDEIEDPPIAPLSDPDMFYRQASVGTLRQVAETLISAPQRRKALVYISPGVAVDPASSSTPKWVEAPRLVNNNTRTNMREANQSLVRGLPDLYSRMQRANVTIYSIDPCGADGLRQYVAARAASIPVLEKYSSLTLPPDFDWLDPGNVVPRPEDLARHLSGLNRDFLLEAAKNTGGLAVVSTNDFDDGLERIFFENSSYYLLAFQTGSQKPGSLHRLSVRVNRPGVTVRTRSGYYSPDAPKPAKDGTLAAPSPLDTAIAGAIPNGMFPMRVALAPFAVPGQKNPVVTIALGLAQPAVTTRTTYMVDLQTNAYSPDGKPRLVGRTQTARVVLVPTDDKNNARYDLLSDISLPPGRYELRLSAHRGLDNISGSLYADVEIPDFTAPLAVSGAVVEALPAGAAAPAGAFDMFLPVVPTSARDFTRAQEVTVFMRVYQGGKGSAMPVEVRTRLVDEFDSAVGEGRDIVYGNQFNVGGRAADYRFAVPVKRLPPGPYLLTFDISLGEITVTRSVQFTVRD